MKPNSGEWEDREVLVTVKAYPEPSTKYGETVCVAGVIADTLDPIRIYPVRFRVLPEGDQFSKYALIRARLMKASDARPESHRVHHEAPIVVGRKITRWPERDRYLQKIRARSIEELVEARRELGHSAAPSLALIRPAEITRFRIERQTAEWTERQKQALRGPRMFEQMPDNELERIPFRFSYDFRCSDSRCKGHNFGIMDWEVGQAYRNFLSKYGDGWQDKMRQKFWDDLVGKCDLQFYVGTLAAHPHIWTIIGLYYPRIGAIPTSG